MGKASLTIAISGEYNSRAVERAQRSLRSLETTAAAAGGGISAGLVNAGAKAAEFGGQVYSAGKKMESIGSAATRSITLPIAGAAAACGAAAVDIDTALTGVRKTVDGTEEQYQSLKRAAIEFSKTNAVSASQILDIQALGAQLGFAIDELDEFSRVVSGLDIATNMDAEQAGTELAQFANITDMAHDKISNYASAIVGLGNTSATTEADISSMAMRIAAAGIQVGMSQADILGLSAALSSMGIEAEAGGTAISTVMANIDKAVATNSEKLSAWADAANMSTEQFASAWKEKPVEALGKVLSGMDAATKTGGNMSLMLEELGISSIRQTDVLKRLAGNSDLVTKSVATANDEWEKNTALQAEVDNRNESMAARFDMLKNKVVAAAESVGTPLVDALLDVVDAAEPLIKGIGAAAQAFADMDEGSQRTILGLVGAAAAFGPVVSIAGKLAKGIGSVSVALGKGLQAAGRFGSSMRSAATQSSGVVASLGKMETSARKAAIKVDAVGKSAKAASVETKALGATSKAASSQIRDVAQQTDKANASMKKASGTAGAFGGVLKGTLIGLATMAIGAAVTYVGMELEKARERAEKLDKATKGLNDSTGVLYKSMVQTKGAYQIAAEGAGAFAASADDVSRAVESMIESNAELAGTLHGIFSEAGASVGTIEGYRETIDRLAGRALEDANDIAELKLAVDGVNQMCGTSYTVAQDAGGAWQIMADGVAKAKDEVLRLIDAQKLQIKLEANKEAWTEAYKTISDHAKAAADATKLYNDELKAHDENARLAAAGDEVAIGALGNYEYRLEQARKRMEEANGTYDAQRDVLERLKDAQVLYQRALDEGADSLAAAISGNDLLLATLESAGQSALELVDDLEDVGISTSDLRKIGEENLPGLATAYDGSIASIADALEGYGIHLDEASLKTKESAEAMEGHIGSFGEALSDKFDESGVKVSDFCQKLSDAGVATSDFQTLTSEQLGQLVQDYDGDIGKVKDKLDGFVADNKAAGANAGKGFKDGYVGQINETVPLVKDGAYQVAANTSQGLAEGFEENDGYKGPWEAICGWIDNFCKTFFGIHSPSTLMAENGRNISIGLGNGMTDAQDGPLGAIGGIAQGIWNAVSSLPAQLLGLGGQSSLNLASGIGSGAEGATTSSASLLQSAWNGVSGLASTFGSVASQAVSRFQGTISAGSAYGSAQNLAVSARNGLGSVDSSGTGRNFVQGFANGFNGVNIFQAAYNVGVGALSAIKRALGIHSPSREAMEVGKMFGLGAVVGMEGTEAAIAAEAGRMSDAMALDPEPYAGKGYGTPDGAKVSYGSYPASQQSRSFTFNVTINVNSANKAQAMEIGQSVGEQLYEEMVRRERAIA